MPVAVVSAPRICPKIPKGTRVKLPDGAKGRVSGRHSTYTVKVRLFGGDEVLVSETALTVLKDRDDAEAGQFGSGSSLDHGAEGLPGVQPHDPGNLGGGGA